MTAARFYITLLATFLVTNIVFGQKNELARKALREIDSIITNPYEFLGKTGEDVKAAGRPASIIGGDKWEEEKESGEKITTGEDKAIVIGTGCGALMMMISGKTNLVYTIAFVAHKKTKLEGMTIWDHLNGVYEFEPKGNAIIPLKDSTFIGLQMLSGGIMLVAYEGDKKTVRFKN